MNIEVDRVIQGNRDVVEWRIIRSTDRVTYISIGNK